MSKKRTQTQPAAPTKNKGKPGPQGKPESPQGEAFIPLEQAVACEVQPLPQTPAVETAPDTAGEKSPAEQRAERIRLLKEQVQEGSYQPDLRRVAQIILYDDTDALLGS